MKPKGLQIIWGRTSIFYRNYLQVWGRPAYYCIDWALGLGILEIRHFVTISPEELKAWVQAEKQTLNFRRE